MKTRATRRVTAWAATLLPVVIWGCGAEKMNQDEGRGGTRVDNVAPQTRQPDIGASKDVDGIKRDASTVGKAPANSSTPYNGGGAGVAPPLSPAPGAPASGDTNSGQTSGEKSGPGSDANTEGAKVNPNASGPGTGTPPK